MTADRPTVELRYKAWLGPLSTVVGLFLVAQVFVPQLRGGFFQHIPVIGHYLPGVLGLWACAMGVAYQFRPIAFVEPGRVRRVGPLFGKEVVIEGAVTVTHKAILVGGTNARVARFLVVDDHWASAQAMATGSAALD